MSNDGPRSWRATELSNKDHEEALNFLALRPLHTVFMASLISENGIVSERNRGAFYGVRSVDGKFSGIGLIGHATLIEARNDGAMQALASGARSTPIPIVLTRGERHEINRFWTCYQASDTQPRLVCNEQLLVHHSRHSRLTTTDKIRPATRKHLEDVININVDLFISESGRNPMKDNPYGFRERIARRIDRKRVWISHDNHGITFKADIVADTPQAIYLESIWVNPKRRGQGHGLECLTNLNSLLLRRTDAICVTVNEKFRGLTAFYQKAGFNKHSSYQTIYLC